MRGRGTILEIQILRGFAALAVVLVHVGIDLNYWARTAIRWTEAGNAGVDLFFVISGFIMVHIAWDQFGARGAAAEFFVRRLIRIVPLYWLVTTGYVLINSYPASRIIASYLFVPDPNGAHLPVILQGWTLNFEMFFYVLFALSLFLSRPWAIGGLSLLMAAIVALGVPIYGNTIILEFVIGMWIAVAFRRGYVLPLLVRRAAIVAGIAAIAATVFLPPHDRLILFGIPAALIVAGATLGDPVANSRPVQWLVILGDASYALYLTHPLMTRMTVAATRDVIGLGNAGTQAVYVAIAFAVSIGFALLIHFYAEKPLTALAKRLWLGRNSAAPAASN